MKEQHDWMLSYEHRSQVAEQEQGPSEDNLSDWFVLRTLYVAGIALDVCELTLPHSMWLGFRAGFVGMLQRTSSVSKCLARGRALHWGFKALCCLFEIPNNLIIA